MAKIARKVAEDKTVSRVIEIPGWVYNLLIDLADLERRNVKGQIERVLEEWGHERRAKEIEQ